MRFAILGAGAIGCLFAAKLKLNGNDVDLIHRNSSVVRAIRKNGITLRQTDGRKAIVRVPIRRGPIRVTDADVLIVAVKAYDTKLAATSYQRKIEPNIAVLSLQNGLGNVEALQSSLENPVMAGSTSEGALSIGAGEVSHTGTGQTMIGTAKGASPGLSLRIKKAFDSAGFRTRVEKNMQGVLWVKAIVNAAINPLTALTRMSNGSVASSGSLIEIGSEVIAEGITVSRSKQVTLVGDPRRLWKKVLVSTGSNKSSMLQDVEKRKMTEIRQLNGAIVAQAKRARINVPINETLVRLILGLEMSYLHGNIPA